MGTPKQGSGEGEGGRHRRVRGAFEEEPKKKTAPVTQGSTQGSDAARAVQGAKAGRKKVDEQRTEDPR